MTSAVQEPHRCPLCASEIPGHGVRVNLEMNNALIDGKLVLLSPTMAPLLYTLAENPHAFVQTDELLQAIWGSNWPKSGALYKLIHELRNTLRNTEWQVVSQRDRGKEPDAPRDYTGYMLCRRTSSTYDPQKLAMAHFSLSDLGVPEDLMPEFMDRILASLK